MSKSNIELEVTRYKAKNPKSALLQLEAQRYLPGGSSRGTSYFDPYPHFIEKGTGPFLFDVDGNKYLDLMINATSLILGHAHPEITAVITDQASKGTAFSGPTESQISFSKVLIGRIPSFDKVRFTNSGTEATMMSIRAARQYTGKGKILKIEGGYHGSHEYVSVSVYPPASKLDPERALPIKEYTSQPDSILDQVYVTPFNDLESVQNILSRYHEEIACVIVEPVVSSFGYLPAQKEFLITLRKLTKELNVVLIFDEVQSFRIAPGGAQEYFNVIPDMTALGKIIGGGLPIGAFGGKDDIMAVFDPTGGGAAVAHAGTFNANPMAMRAGEIVMEHLTDEVYESINHLGTTLRDQLSTLLSEFEIDATVTGIASMFGVHFSKNPIHNYRDVLMGDRDLKRAFFVGMLNENVLLQSGVAGSLNVLNTEEHVSMFIDSARNVLRRIRQ